MPFTLFRFNDNRTEKITEETIKRYVEISPRRRQAIEMITSIEGKDFFNPGFSESIESFFRQHFGLSFRKNKNGKLFYRITSDNEREKIINWLKYFGNIVFIRDALTISIALDYYCKGFKDSYTEIGSLIHNVKYMHIDCYEEIVDKLYETINKIPFYDSADFICAVPPSSDKQEIDVPSEIARILSNKLGKEDITPFFSCGLKRKSLKNAKTEEKLEILRDWSVQMNKDLSNKKIILIDDLYQSGTTMMFIAQKLQEAGATAIYGICGAKNLSNTENSWG